MGVVLQVEQLRAVDLREPKELPSFVAHRSLGVLVGQEDGVADLRSLAADDRREAPPVEAFRHGRSDEIAGGREDVVNVCQRVRLAPRDARPGQQQRNLHRVLVDVLLAHQPVTADRDALIGREDDDRLVGQLQFVEAVEKSPDVMVHAGDERVVVMELAADGVLRARPGLQKLVADHLIDVPRVGGLVVGRQGDLRGIVEVAELLGRPARIVRARQPEVHEERSRLVTLAPEERDGVVDDLSSRSPRRQRVDHVDVLPVIELRLDLWQVGRAALLAVVRLVPGGPHRFREGRLGRVGVRHVLLDEAFLAAVVVEAEPRAAAHGHVPGRDADRPRVSAQAVRVAEHERTLRKPVQARRDDVRISQRGDRVEPLVVGENEQDVRFARRGALGGFGRAHHAAHRRGAHVFQERSPRDHSRTPPQSQITSRASNTGPSLQQSL